MRATYVLVFMAFAGTAPVVQAVQLDATSRLPEGGMAPVPGETFFDLAVTIEQADACAGPVTFLFRTEREPPAYAGARFEPYSGPATATPGGVLVQSTMKVGLSEQAPAFIAIELVPSVTVSCNVGEVTDNATVHVVPSYAPRIKATNRLDVYLRPGDEKEENFTVWNMGNAPTRVTARITGLPPDDDLELRLTPMVVIESNPQGLRPNTVANLSLAVRSPQRTERTFAIVLNATATENAEVSASTERTIEVFVRVERRPLPAPGALALGLVVAGLAYIRRRVLADARS